MQARISVVAGRRLRQQLEQSAALREVLHHPAALAARRTAARTARQIAPRAADRFIADFKGTAPLLASVRAERRTARRGSTLRLAATLSAAAVVGGLLIPAQASAAEADLRYGDLRTLSADSGDRPAAESPLPLGSLTDPQLYPRPQQLRPAGRPVAVPRQVTVVLADGADGPAVDAVRRLLTRAGAAEVLIAPEAPEAPAAGSLLVYLGGPHEGAGGATDRALRQLAVAGGLQDTEAPGLAGLPAGGYLLATGQLPTAGGQYGAVVLAGVDGTGTFYAAQSLAQLLAPVGPGQGQGGEGDKGFPGVLVRDFPSGAPVRGTAESFFGAPWSAAQRLAAVDFLGRTKQNFFLYGPGGDPYRSQRWREPYPAEQARELTELAARARDNHVTLAYAIDPGQSFCFSSGKDVDALVAKLDGLRRMGFRAFQLEFLDVSYDEWHCGADRRKFGTGPVAAAKAQAALAAAVQQRLIAPHPELAPLSVVPTEYQKQGATPYRSALAAGLPGEVQVVWSGGAVIPKQVTGGQLDETAALYRRPLVTLDNYPVNDSAPDRLFLGGYGGRDADVAKRSAVLLTSAMSQPVASRIPLATAADYGWQPDGYQPEQSLAGALRLLAAGPAQQSALAALAGNSASSPLGGKESGYLAPLLERFWAAAEPASGAPADPARLQEAAQPLREAFSVMADAPRTLAGDPLAADAAPWLARLSAYGAAGRAAVDMLLAQHGGDGTAAWQARLELGRQRGVLEQNPVTVGKGVLDPFLDRAVKSADTWSGITAGAAPTTTLGTAHDHGPALMADGSTQTFYWSSAPPQVGDSFGLDLGTPKPLGSVTVLMGGDGPDADAAADDYLHDGVLEYFSGSGGWQKLATVHGQRTVTASAPAGAVARAVRLRATGGQKTAVAVREFTAAAPGAVDAEVSGPPAAPGSSAAAVLSGDPDSAFRAAAPPIEGDALTVELGSARPLDRLTVLTDPVVRAEATAQVRRPDGSWADLGAVRPGYNELRADGGPVDAFRLVWKPGSEAPVVNQVIPWYADVPAARVTLAEPTLDVVAGAAAPAQTRATVESGRAELLTGELKAEVPPLAKGLTVAPVPSVTVPRGGRVGAPVLVSAAADTPSGSYRVPLVFTAGGLTVRQELVVHVVPPTGGPDLARTATASSSGDDSAKTPASAVADGDPKSSWTAPAEDDAWVQLRLPQPVRLGSAVLHWGDAYASGYRVETSADGLVWTTAAVVENGQGGTETVRFDAPGARYLRVQGVSRATRYGYALTGVELYGVQSP
ncbi:beta-N-acetylglucosaminidase domain-containing protein [Streptomyces sp. TLI_171]|uniref:beta-N-acetylglucosaminidase domain-containing protein n=1 Tax=Streptomyces sp. TLI_171 TaxID=1938859 RepID=UPI000C474EBA|nr:beta-N-acetylglucosaminidase domain-containing protein [Streptomyces sp. TLI_171]RKE21616.1 hyaluronoglucosaminidase [Streptomyces sp. TLI_171]